MLDDALAEWLAGMRCPQCTKDGARRAGRLLRGSLGELTIHEWSTWTDPDCEDCQDAFYSECAGHTSITYAVR